MYFLDKKKAVDSKAISFMGFILAKNCTFSMIRLRGIFQERLFLKILSDRRFRLYSYKS